MLSEIKWPTGQNESSRTIAITKLRVLTEETVRELHLKVLGAPPPSNFDAARPPELLALFRTIPGTTTTEYAGLKDTVDFADPAHHSEPGYTIPQETNIHPQLMA
jgi:hypothetical protein